MNQYKTELSEQFLKLHNYFLTRHSSRPAFGGRLTSPVRPLSNYVDLIKDPKDAVGPRRQ